jgi:hypothetical protein
LFLNGSAAGSRSLSIVQDTNNPGLLDIEPQANTTINGSTQVYQVSIAQIQHDISISLNNGSGTSNSTVVIFDVNSFVLPGNLGLNLTGNGNDTVTLNHGNVHGALFLTTGAGNDSINVNHVKIDGATFINSGAGNDYVGLIAVHLNGNTFIDTGIGTDEVFIQSSTLTNAYITERGADNYLTAHDSTMSSFNLVEQGSLTNADLHSVIISGSLSITQSSGQHYITLNATNVAGTVAINAGDAILLPFPIGAPLPIDQTFPEQVSFVGLFQSQFGSLTVHGGNGDFFLVTNSISVKRGVAISLGNGNSNVGMLGSEQIGGATSINLGNGNSTVVFGSIHLLTVVFGPDSNIPSPIPFSTFAGVSINIGDGQSSISVNNLNAASFNVTTGHGSSYVGIGGAIQIPEISNNLWSGYAHSGGPALFNNGPIAFSGPVEITSLGSNNTVVINQASFQKSFNLFDFGGRDTLIIDASVFNGPVSARMGGTGNIVNIATNAGYSPIPFPGEFIPALVVALPPTIFNGAVHIRFPNAPSVGGGGTVTFGGPGTAGVTVNKQFVVRGGSVKESAGLTGASNLKLGFSKLI